MSRSTWSYAIRTSTPDRIVAVSSPFATKGEFRAGKSEGKRSVSAIQALANATIELNADQPHILPLGLTELLDGYQYFLLVLTFERAGQIAIASASCALGMASQPHPKGTKGYVRNDTHEYLNKN